MTTDLLQVGLTDAANGQLLELRSATPYFGEESDIYRFAVAVALALGVTEISTAMKRQQLTVNKFRVHFDPGGDEGPSARLDTTDGLLAEMISAHRPEWSSEPYRVSQYLAVIGINFLHQKLVQDGLGLGEAMQLLQDP